LGTNTGWASESNDILQIRRIVSELSNDAISEDQNKIPFPSYSKGGIPGS